MKNVYILFLSESRVVGKNHNIYRYQQLVSDIRKTIGPNKISVNGPEDPDPQERRT